jgi:hypothetical protein
MHAISIDFRHCQLPHAMQQQYLLDLQAWVADTCRAAIRCGGAADRDTAEALLDGLFPSPGAGASFARWDAIGPHAAIARENGLSPDAVAILLLTAAPRMWGGLLHVYAAITGRTAIDDHALAVLLRSQMTVVRELSREAPLVAFGVVSRRPTGSLTVNRDVVCRLAGN